MSGMSILFLDVTRTEQHSPRQSSSGHVQTPITCNNKQCILHTIILIFTISRLLRDLLSKAEKSDKTLLPTSTVIHLEKEKPSMKESRSKATRQGEKPTMKKTKSKEMASGDVWTEAEKAELLQYYTYCLAQHNECVKNLEVLHQQEQEMKLLLPQRESNKKFQEQYDEIARKATKEVALMGEYFDLLSFIEGEMDACGLTDF